MEIIKTNKMYEPDLSVIMPIYNEEKYLPIVLESFKNQKTDLKTEIIIIDDNSTDRSVEIAEKYNCTIYKNAEKLSVTQMRNFGFSVSHGKAILHTDGDTAFSNNYVEKMVRPIINGKYDVTLCMKLYPLEAKYNILPEKYSKSYAFFLKNLPDVLWLKMPMRFFLWIKRWISRIIRTKKFISLFNIPDRVEGAAIIVKREIAEKSGGWDKPFGAHSDTSYTEKIYNLTDKIHWIWGVKKYSSVRRLIPTHEFWFIDKLFPFIKKLNNKNKIQNQNG
ncbi:MAG: glycosyltransferase, partial [Spirochaetota bacterium]